MTRTLSRALLALTVIGVAGLSGCGTTTFSQIDGQPFSRVDYKIYPVVVSKVDNESVLTMNPQRIDPGKRSITLIAPPAPGFVIPTERVVQLDVQPCVRYVYGARRENRLMNAWEPVLLEQFPIAGCDANKRTASLESSTTATLAAVR